MTDRFYGRYPGTVEQNADPKNLCRLKVKVHEVLGDELTGWCLPSTPYGGPGVGLAAVPPRGSIVFVEWPAGDLTRTPVWSGAFWPDGKGVPGAGPGTILLVTPGGHKVELIDEPVKDRAIRLTAASGATVSLTGDGVTIKFRGQQIVVSGSKISVNNGNLEVT